MDTKSCVPFIGPPQPDVIDKHGQRDFYPCLRKIPLTGIRVPAPVDGSVDKSVEDGRRLPIFGGDENKRPALHLAAGVQKVVQIQFEAKRNAAVILLRQRLAIRCGDSGSERDAIWADKRANTKLESVLLEVVAYGARERAGVVRKPEIGTLAVLEIVADTSRND